MYLTICTPTYNRALTLKRVYASLIAQKNKNFEWIVIDDGSTDETEMLVNEWIEQKKILISYYKQKNQGKHIALNKGISLAKGELFTCLDSDDWFYKNAVEEVNRSYQQIKNDKNVAGIIGLNTLENGKVLGTTFNKFNKKNVNFIDLIYKYKIKGDKAYFYKTKLLRKYDFPSYRENKHMPPSYQHYQISKKYNLLISNVLYKYVEYQDDGISKNKYNKYIVAADNFSYYRLSIAKLIPTKKKKIINAIHFNATQFLGDVKIVPTDKNTHTLFILFKPLGIILGLYIKRSANLTSRKL